MVTLDCGVGRRGARDRKGQWWDGGLEGVFEVVAGGGVCDECPTAVARGKGVGLSVKYQNTTKIIIT